MNDKENKKEVKKERINKETVMRIKIKNWYIEKYPEDKLGQEINPNVTFEDLFEALDTYKDVYEVLGGNIDSLIRERCFEKLSEIMEVPYDYIYDQWTLSNF